jgi:hypothetical protein
MLPDEVVSRAAAEFSNSRIAQAQLIRIARINDSILNDQDELLEHLVTQSTLYYGLGQQGMLDRLGRVRKDAVAQGFSQHHHLLFPLPQFSDALSTAGVARMTSILARRAILSPLQLVLLIDYVFGSWMAFKERGRWECALGLSMQTQAPSQRLNYLPDAATKTYHRQTCISMLNENPESTRSIFAKTTPKSFYWLSRHDKTWLDQVLPCHVKSTQRILAF